MAGATGSSGYLGEINARLQEVRARLQQVSDDTAVEMSGEARRRLEFNQGRDPGLNVEFSSHLPISAPSESRVSLSVNPKRPTRLPTHHTQQSSQQSHQPPPPQPRPFPSEKDMRVSAGPAETAHTHYEDIRVSADHSAHGVATASVSISKASAGNGGGYPSQGGVEPERMKPLPTGKPPAYPQQNAQIYKRQAKDVRERVLATVARSREGLPRSDRTDERPQTYQRRVQTAPAPAPPPHSLDMRRTHSEYQVRQATERGMQSRVVGRPPHTSTSLNLSEPGIRHTRMQGSEGTESSQQLFELARGELEREDDITPPHSAHPANRLTGSSGGWTGESGPMSHGVHHTEPRPGTHHEHVHVPPLVHTTSTSAQLSRSISLRASDVDDSPNLGSASIPWSAPTGKSNSTPSYTTSGAMYSSTTPPPPRQNSASAEINGPGDARHLYHALEPDDYEEKLPRRGHSDRDVRPFAYVSGSTSVLGEDEVVRTTIRSSKHQQHTSRSVQSAALQMSRSSLASIQEHDVGEVESEEVDNEREVLDHHQSKLSVVRDSLRSGARGRAVPPVPPEILMGDDDVYEDEEDSLDNETVASSVGTASLAGNKFLVSSSIEQRANDGRLGMHLPRFLIVPLRY